MKNNCCMSGCVNCFYYKQYKQRFIYLTRINNVYFFIRKYIL